MSMMSPTRFYEMTQAISIALLWQSYHNLDFIRIWPQKPIFLRDALGSASIIWDWH